MSVSPTPREHREIAHSWPAIPFGASIVLVLISAALHSGLLTLLGTYLLIASFIPCCLIRDWWLAR